MLVSREGKVVFIHTSRTGGTAIRSVLRGHFPEIDEPLYEHASAREAARFFGGEYESYFRFAFVRNPWARFWSWYGMLKKTAGAEDFSFDEFLRSWIREDGSLELANQVDFLSDDAGVLLVNEIGRFEDFESELRRILRLAGIGGALALPHVNSGSDGCYEEGYSNDGRELVSRAYQRDIEAFGYRF